jgi:hypothetical protein
MSPAENSPTLLARRATQFVELSVTDGTGYRYDSNRQRVHPGINTVSFDGRGLGILFGDIFDDDSGSFER